MLLILYVGLSVVGFDVEILIAAACVMPAPPAVSPRASLRRWCVHSAVLRGVTTPLSEALLAALARDGGQAERGASVAALVDAELGDVDEVSRVRVATAFALPYLEEIDLDFGFTFGHMDVGANPPFSG